MTTEREKVIDFVNPYFDQASNINIKSRLNLHYLEIDLFRMAKGSRFKGAVARDLLISSNKATSGPDLMIFRVYIFLDLFRFRRGMKKNTF